MPPGRGGAGWHQAHHDSLTGLPNRLVLEDRLDTAIRQAQLNGVPTSVLFIDLNDFKMVNDRDGHGMGDELLVAAADRLRETLRIDDTLARIGGDEFVVLLDGIDRDCAVRVAERLVAAIDWTQRYAARWPVGLFGASTGAAAALVAAAQRPEAMHAVVSRGGRPDLAGPVLAYVRAPTLLIGGGEDHQVLELNRKALLELRSEKQLVIVPGATHLFGEPGALDEVARLARAWFERHLLAREEHALPR